LESGPVTSHPTQLRLLSFFAPSDFARLSWQALSRLAGFLQYSNLSYIWKSNPRLTLAAWICAYGVLSNVAHPAHLIPTPPARFFVSMQEVGALTSNSGH